MPASSGSFRDRLVWPDAGAAPHERARAMALAYRETARTAQARLDAARKALASLDLRVLRFADEHAAKAVQALVADEGPDPVVALDARFSEWGETWHADPPEFTFDDDDWVPAAIAVEIMGRNANTLGDYRMKGDLRGRYVKHGNSKGFLYRVGDLRALRAKLAAETGVGRKPPRPGRYQ